MNQDLFYDDHQERDLGTAEIPAGYDWSSD